MTMVKTQLTNALGRANAYQAGRIKISEHVIDLRNLAAGSYYAPQILNLSHAKNVLIRAWQTDNEEYLTTITTRIYNSGGFDGTSGIEIPGVSIIDHDPFQIYTPALVSLADLDANPAPWYDYEAGSAFVQPGVTVSGPINALVRIELWVDHRSWLDSSNLYNGGGGIIIDGFCPVRIWDNMLPIAAAASPGP